MASKLHLRRWVSRILRSPAIYTTPPPLPSRVLQGPARLLLQRSFLDRPFPPNPRSFCSSPLNLDESQVPAAIDYSCVSVGENGERESRKASSFPHNEDEFHKLADSTIHALQEKLEEYGDDVDMDGFDVDYGNDVLTVKLGDLGTYVLNKQTPNRQIWLSSPVSGPSRFDWDQSSKSWVYRRNRANLLKVLETELEELCGQAIDLS